MPGFEGGTRTSRTAEGSKGKELALRPPENEEAYDQWRRKLRMCDTLHELRSRPVDIWPEVGEYFDTKSKDETVLHGDPDTLLDTERFDLLYQYGTLGKKLGAYPGAAKRFFTDAKAIRSKLSALIDEGRLRSATYLLRTVEEFYPRRGISSAEFAQTLPEYPTLPVTYSNMEKRLSPEKEDPLPLQDTIGFCIKEALLGDLLHLSHEVETVASSTTISDEVKDSALRPLRISIRDAINGLEADIDRIGVRLGKLYFGAVLFRLSDRDHDWRAVWANPKEWRDNEDALNSMTSIVSRFDQRSMGPWTKIAEGVSTAMKVAFGREPHDKGALRSAIDHLLDISHYDGNIMSWLGKNSRSDEAHELLEFPTVFFECRRYAGEHAGAEMLEFINELQRLARTEARHDIPYNVSDLEDAPMFEKRYPLISRTIRQTRNHNEVNSGITSAINLINDEYHSGKRFSKYLPPRFLKGLQEEVDGRGLRVADLRAQLDKLKQAYGYRAV